MAYRYDKERAAVAGVGEDAKTSASKIVGVGSPAKKGVIPSVADVVFSSDRSIAETDAASEAVRQAINKNIKKQGFRAAQDAVRKSGAELDPRITAQLKNVEIAEGATLGERIKNTVKDPEFLRSVGEAAADQLAGELIAEYSTLVQGAIRDAQQVRDTGIQLTVMLASIIGRLPQKVLEALGSTVADVLSARLDRALGLIQSVEREVGSLLAYIRSLSALQGTFNTRKGVYLQAERLAQQAYRTILRAEGVLNLPESEDTNVLDAFRSRSTSDLPSSRQKLIADADLAQAERLYARIFDVLQAELNRQAAEQGQDRDIQEIKERIAESLSIIAEDLKLLGYQYIDIFLAVFILQRLPVTIERVVEFASTATLAKKVENLSEKATEYTETVASRKRKLYIGTITLSLDSSNTLLMLERVAQTRLQFSTLLSESGSDYYKALLGLFDGSGPFGSLADTFRSLFDLALPVVAAVSGQVEAAGLEAAGVLTDRLRERGRDARRDIRVLQQDMQRIRNLLPSDIDATKRLIEDVFGVTGYDDPLYKVSSGEFAEDVLRGRFKKQLPKSMKKSPPSGTGIGSLPRGELENDVPVKGYERIDEMPGQMAEARERVSNVANSRAFERQESTITEQTFGETSVTERMREAFLAQDERRFILQERVGIGGHPS